MYPDGNTCGSSDMLAQLFDACLGVGLGIRPKLAELVYFVCSLVFRVAI